MNGKTVLITGATRGIGHAMALRLARAGANVVIAAKTVVSTEKRPGTIHDAAKAVDEAGGRGLGVQVDVRDPALVQKAIDAAVETFGGLDAVINNAGAIFLAPTEVCPAKRFDLMMQVNVRASFLVAQAAIPHLKKSANPHILTLSPPIDLAPHWFGPHTAYTISKYGMTMLTIGLAEELKNQGIAANALWPRTTIATAAVGMLGGDDLMRRSRTPEIMADAAFAILSRDSRTCTGNAFLDEDVLREEGVTDFLPYRVDPEIEPSIDLFVTK